MKKVVLKTFAVVMCLAMVACVFAGCGKKHTAYVIGATGPLTGDAASYGISVKNGAELAIDQINEAGGLNGVKFEFEMMDDVADAKNVTAAYDSLVKKGMQISIGSITSGACEQFANLSKDDNLFFMTPSASAASCIKASNAYRICFGDPDQGVLSAQELTKTYSKIGVIYNSDDPYSSGIFSAFKDEMGKLDKAFVEAPFTNDSKNVFTTQLQKLKGEGCDVVFLPIYYQEASLIIKEAKTLSYTADIFGCDGLDGIVKYLAEDAEGSELIKGVRYLTPFDVNSTDEKVSAFVSAYKDKYGVEPDQFAADGYDAIMVIYEAMKKAGVDNVNISMSELCDKVKEVINGDFTYVGATGSMTWNAAGEPTKAPQIVTIK